MKILAVETTGAILSTAVATEEKILAVFTANHKKTHSVSLMPMIDNMLKFVETDIEEIDYIACSSGPGSFTGLRIGAATVKGIAYALGKKVIPVPTLDSMAYAAHLYTDTIVPMIDARNNQVFTAFYKYENGILKRNSGYIADDIEKILSEIKGEKAIFLGDGAFLHKEKIIKCGFDTEESTVPNAENLCKMALKNIDNAVDSNKFELMYLRKSQAERELERKNL